MNHNGKSIEGESVSNPSQSIATDLDQPILFRTTSASIGEQTLNGGSLWLRSDQYYRELEDAVRNDKLEGINSGSTTVPLLLGEQGSGGFQIFGEGAVGKYLSSHYILSLHGSSISNRERNAFGGYTFGVRNLFKLAVDIFYLASRQIECTGYRYGPVAYQRTALTQSLNARGGAAIQFGGFPPRFLNPIDLDVLRKLPIEPFIQQDEWRIAIFTNGYLQGDSTKPLILNVDASHFFPYLT